MQTKIQKMVFVFLIILSGLVALNSPYEEDNTSHW